MPDRPPNILLITTDQQRYDAMGINGNRQLQTPNLDHLAASGTNFSRCYVSCPVCIPARRTLISGLHPDTHGMPGYRDGWEFNPAHTMPGCLSAAGYQTQLIGKLHLHPRRKRFGYDHMILSDSANHRPTSPIGADNDYADWLVTRGVSYTGSSHGLNGNGRLARPWNGGEEYHQTSYLAEQAATFFEKTRDPSSPWFLHLSFTAPHPPLTPPEVYWDRYVGMDDLRPHIGEWAPKGPTKANAAPDAQTGPFDPEQIRRAMVGYYGLINHIDDRVAYVIDQFFEYQNPRSKEPFCVIFTSDHGEMLGDHHLFRKSVPYESSAHVPLFISGRNFDLPKGTCDALVGWEDIMPTVLDLAGVDIPEGLDGRSLLPVMRGDADARREQFDGLCMDSTPHRYLLAGDLKYIWFVKTGEEQLFDVTADPHELCDLSGDSVKLEPMRKRMGEVARRVDADYDTATLRPCANNTPLAIKF